MHIVINGTPYSIGDRTDVAWLYRQCLAAANGAVTTLVLTGEGNGAGEPATEVVFINANTSIRINGTEEEMADVLRADIEANQASDE